MDKKVILYVVIGIVILGLVLFTLFPGMVHAIKDFRISSNAIEDKCSPAPGYDEESWREHMGHHPNIYKECLE